MTLSKKIPLEAYNSEGHVRAFQDAINIQVEEVQAARDDFKLQCSPITATWGLSFYEREVGIPVDESKHIEQRRSLYLAKRRGVGTTTTEVLRNIAKSFCDGSGNVDIIEHKRDFWFQIVFTNTSPFNLKDLLAAIDELKPAHMEAALLRQYTSIATVGAVLRPKIGRVIKVRPYQPDLIQATVTVGAALHIKCGRRLHVYPKGD